LLKQHGDIDDLYDQASGTSATFAQAIEKSLSVIEAQLEAHTQRSVNIFWVRNIAEVVGHFIELLQQTVNMRGLGERYQQRDSQRFNLPNWSYDVKSAEKSTSEQSVNIFQSPGASRQPLCQQVTKQPLLMLRPIYAAKTHPAIADNRVKETLPSTFAKAKLTTTAARTMPPKLQLTSFKQKKF